MDLTPAETTPTGVLLSSVKSALISKANYQKYVGRVKHESYYLGHLDGLHPLLL